jgi:hypothetical protein
VLPDPDALIQGHPGHISGEWSVRWVFGSTNGEEYLEFYARHRMTNDRHVRIYVSGSVEDLPAPIDAAAGFPMQLRSPEENRALRDELREKGLLG